MVLAIRADCCMQDVLRGEVGLGMRREGITERKRRVPLKVYLKVAMSQFYLLKLFFRNFH